MRRTVCFICLVLTAFVAAPAQAEENCTCANYQNVWEMFKAADGVYAADWTGKKNVTAGRPAVFTVASVFKGSQKLKDTTFGIDKDRDVPAVCEGFTGKPGGSYLVFQKRHEGRTTLLTDCANDMVRIGDKGELFLRDNISLGLGNIAVDGAAHLDRDMAYPKTAEYMTREMALQRASSFLSAKGFNTSDRVVSEAGYVWRKQKKPHWKIALKLPKVSEEVQVVRIYGFGQDEVELEASE